MNNDSNVIDMSIRIEDFQCEGLLPILESFPSYISAMRFVMAFRPSFLKSPQNQALINHFTEHDIIYDEGIKIERWLLDGRLHRKDGPARIAYRDDKIDSEEWYKGGSIHRIDGPAIISYEEGKIAYEKWYQNGLRHRVDGPASIGYYSNGKLESEHWYRNGKIHRNNGPAWIEYYEDQNNKQYEVWYQNNEPHRNYGPALIRYYEDGKIESKEWYKNGKFIKYG